MSNSASQNAPIFKEHHYKANITWTGNKGVGTRDYRAYERNHTLSITNKADILGSSDPSFSGDPTRHNPEDLFVSSIAACHMLWYLHVCAVHGITVMDYRDEAIGTMVEAGEEGGHFTEIILHPVVTITDPAQVDKANELHKEAHKKCFMANSCNFPIRHIPSCTVKS